MAHSYDRLKLLFNELGIDDQGLLVACSTEIEKILRNFDNIFDIIFICDNENQGLKKLKSLTDISPLIYQDENEMLNKIKSVLGAKYGDYFENEFLTEKEYAGFQDSFSYNNDYFIFEQGTETITKEILKKLSYIFKNYHFAGFRTTSKSKGIEYDKWDALGLTFDELDYMELDFIIYDRIK